MKLVRYPNELYIGINSYTWRTATGRSGSMRCFTMMHSTIIIAIMFLVVTSVPAEILYSSSGGFDPADWHLTDAEIIDGKIYVAPDQERTARAELIGSDDWGACLITMRVEIERSATIHIFALQNYFFMTNPQAYGQPTASDNAQIYLRDGINEGGGTSVLYANQRIEIPPHLWTIQWGILGTALVIRTWSDVQIPGSFSTMEIGNPELTGPLWLLLYGNDGSLIVHDLVVEGLSPVSTDYRTWGNVKAIYSED